MNFKGQKKNFILSRLFMGILILFLISILVSILKLISLTIIYDGYLYLIFLIFMFFLWKCIFTYISVIDYDFSIHVVGNLIRIKDIKEYGYGPSGGRRHINRIVEKEYDIIKLQNFKENLNHFVLYGNIEMKKTITKYTVLKKTKSTEEYKTLEKLIIRKNFDEKEVKLLLNNAIKSNSIVDDQACYYKYYKIQDKNTGQFVLFKIDQIDKMWFYLNQNGKWDKLGNLDQVFENKKDELKEITSEEANNIQNTFNNNKK